jgi:hypothetical protein
LGGGEKLRLLLRLGLRQRIEPIREFADGQWAHESHLIKCSDKLLNAFRATRLRMKYRFSVYGV